MTEPHARTAATPRRAMALRPLAGLAGFAAGIIRSPIGRYVVDGPSMEPAYRAGDRVLVNRLAYLRRSPAEGDVVVLRDPERTGHILLKRVARAPEGICPGPAQLYVLGDNAGASRDSRAFGLVDQRQILGRAWLVY